MSRGDGRTAPASLDAWRQRLAEAEETIEQLTVENEDLRGRLEEIGAIAAPDQVQQAKETAERIERMENLLARALGVSKVVTIPSEPA